MENFSEFMLACRKAKLKCGIALNPKTPLSRIIPFLAKVDFALVMAVAPGKSGQKSTSSLSAFDRILLLTEPAPVGSAETDPFVLTIDGDDTVSLEGNPAPPEALAPPGDAYGGVPSGAQQTFISGDLRESAGQSAYPSQQISGLRKTLETMKATLLRVLAYLRPFGRPQSEAFDEWAE